MYKKPIILSVFSGSLLFLSSCHKPGMEGFSGQVRLHVVATWEGQPFQVSQEYHDLLNHRVFVDGLKFYLSDVALDGPSGAVELMDIDLFDLEGDATHVSVVPVGTYDALNFGLGVRSDLNMSDPVQYPAGHPLSVSNGTYWTWATGYRFVMLDGRYDTDPNGTGTVLPTFSIHSGKNDCYVTATRQAPAPIHVASGDTTEVYLSFAVDRFFYTSTDTIDVSVDNQSHGNNLPLALRYTDCFIQSTSFH